MCSKFFFPNAPKSLRISINSEPQVTNFDVDRFERFKVPSLAWIIQCQLANNEKNLELLKNIIVWITTYNLLGLPIPNLSCGLYACSSLVEI
jgi:hypothetical protein